MASMEELLGLTRELREGVQGMAGRQVELERRLGRLESGRPNGYEPHDGGEGQSLAGWVASRGSGERPPEGAFSLGRLVQAMATGDRGMLTEVERQALVEGSDSSGGVLVADALAATVIDFVRARSVVVAAGATVIGMESDTLTWPRVKTPATPKWKAELDPMEESALTFDALTFDAETLRTKVKMSQELAEDMTADGSAAIERELISAFALEVDRVASRAVARRRSRRASWARSGWPSCRRAGRRSPTPTCRRP